MLCRFQFELPRGMDFIRAPTVSEADLTQLKSSFFYHTVRITDKKWKFFKSSKIKELLILRNTGK